MARLTTARKVLLALVVVNLIDGVISIVDEGVTPSWVVYPILLVIGTVLLLRKPSRVGIAFLGASALIFVLVHIPFTVEALSPGPCENPADSQRECSSVLWPITLTGVPVVTVIASGWAWRRERRGPTPPAERSAPGQAPS
ncbi:hypothetical protein BH18ACT14_BH18ACT14_13780 [soil metagenome]